MTGGKQDIRVGLDRSDPTKQLWKLGTTELRLGVEQVETLIALAQKYLKEQRRHHDGARIVVPAQRYLRGG